MLLASRFFNMLEIQEGNFHPVGICCAIYKGGLMSEILETNFMNEKYTWARISVFA
jgi:hypothetical protein